MRKIIIRLVFVVYVPSNPSSSWLSYQLHSFFLSKSENLFNIHVQHYLQHIDDGFHKQQGSDSGICFVMMTY